MKKKILFAVGFLAGLTLTVSRFKKSGNNKSTIADEIIFPLFVYAYTEGIMDEIAW